MIVVQKKSSYSLTAFLVLMGGVLGTIYLIANAKPRAVFEHPVLVALGLIVFIGVFYVLPIYTLITKTEIIVDKRVLTVKSYPPIKQRVYPLKELVEWQLKEGYGRYGSYTHLYLKFANTIEKALSFTKGR